MGKDKDGNGDVKMSNWTAKQKMAIEENGRDILVAAAAGSGKTAVLVERVVENVVKRGIGIDEMAVVTFTKAAAAEMKSRIRSRFEEILASDPNDTRLINQITLLQDAPISTIDSFCLNIVKTHWQEAGTEPGVRPAENEEIKLLKDDVFAELIEEKYAEGSEDFLEFVMSYSDSKNDKGIEKMVFDLYDSAIINPWPFQWLDDLLDNYKIEKKEDISKDKFIKLYTDSFKESLQIFKNQLEETYNLMSSSEAFVNLLITAEEDMDILERIMYASDIWELSNTLKTVKFSVKKRLKKERSPEDEELADNFDFLRKKYKKTIEDGKSMIEPLSDDSFFGAVETSKFLKKMFTVLVDITKEFIIRTDREKREKNIITFNDMEHLALDVLVKNNNGDISLTDCAPELRETYKEILVDEYQDSNMLQEVIMSSVSNGSNYYMVGDVKQSIYAFRKARPDIFLGKYNSFREDKKGEALNGEDNKGEGLKIVLKENFRSRKRVLDGVNDIFNAAMNNDYSDIQYGIDESLSAGLEYPAPPSGVNVFDGEKGKTELIIITKEKGDSLEKDSAEGDLIVKKIKNLFAQKINVFDKKTSKYRPIQFRDITILLRSTAMSENLVRILTDNGIPAYHETKRSYLTTYEVRPIINMLRIIDNPLDDISLAGAMLSFFGKFTPDELAMIRMTDRSDFLFNNMKMYVENDNADQVIKDKIGEFLETVSLCRDKVFDESIYDMLYDVVMESGYYSYISTMPEASKRTANIDMLLNRALSFAGTSYNGLFQFLRYIDKIQEENEGIGEISGVSEIEDVVKIMTIHKSKGLEFPVVFLADASKMFNMTDEKDKLLTDDRLGAALKIYSEENRIKRENIYTYVFKGFKKKELINEELRILYVAMTRAREKLFILGEENISMNKEDAGKVREDWGSYEKLIYKKRKEMPGLFDTGRINGVELSTIQSYMDVLLPVVMNKEISGRGDGNFELKIIDQDREASAKEEYPVSGIKSSSASDKIVGGFAGAEFVKEPYKYEKETVMPPKVTVTQLKTMMMDEKEEAYEYRIFGNEDNNTVKTGNTDNNTDISAADIGTAYHTIMEKIDYGKTPNEEYIGSLMEELKQDGLLKISDVEIIDKNKIARFITSDIGKRIKEASITGRLKREQEFMVALDMEDRSEPLIVQGIMDLLFEEDDGFVILDYKTDKVNSDNGREVLITRYKTQLDYYAKALEQITKKKVKEKLIYSFSLDEVISVGD